MLYHHHMISFTIITWYLAISTSGIRFTNYVVICNYVKCTCCLTEKKTNADCNESWFSMRYSWEGTPITVCGCFENIGLRTMFVNTLLHVHVSWRHYIDAIPHAQSCTVSSFSRLDRMICYIWLLSLNDGCLNWTRRIIEFNMKGGGLTGSKCWNCGSCFGLCDLVQPWVEGLSCKNNHHL